MATILALLLAFIALSICWIFYYQNIGFDKTISISLLTLVLCIICILALVTSRIKKIKIKKYTSLFLMGTTILSFYFFIDRKNNEEIYQKYIENFSEEKYCKADAKTRLTIERLSIFGIHDCPTDFSH